MQKNLLKINNYIEQRQKIYPRYKLAQDFKNSELLEFITATTDESGLLNYQLMKQFTTSQIAAALIYIANNLG
jgi:hypothetical protein